MGNSTANGRNWKKRALACLLAFSMVAQQGGVTFAGETEPVVSAAAEQDAAAAQAEAERLAKEQAEAEAKAKAEEEARIKAEEEARIKAEEEARAKAEAEEKARQESEAKAKAEAEAAAKAKEESEKAAAESEQKAKEESEKSAQTAPSTEAASTEGQTIPDGTILDSDVQDETTAPAIAENEQPETADAHDADTEIAAAETQMSEPETMLTETETPVIESETESETETEATQRVYPYEDANVKVVATLSKASQIPDDAELVVRPVTPAASEYNYDAYMEALNGATIKECDQNNTLLYDIAFIGPEKDEDGNETGNQIEYQPEEGSVRISVTLKQSQISEGLGTDQPQIQSQDVEVFHLPLTENVKDETSTTAEATGITASDISVEGVSNQNVQLAGSTDQVTFSASSFSVFAFTVDFHYEGVDYSIPGMSQILLSALIEKLNIKNGDTLLNVSDVASVEFSDNKLVTVEQVSGLITYNKEENADVGEKDFLLTSKKAFTSDERLIITLLDGTMIEVGVTDVQTSTELKTFLTNLIINPSTVDENGNLVVNPDTECTVKLNFNETSDLQFADRQTLTYQLPDGVTILSKQDKTIYINITSAGKTYKVPAALEVTTDGQVSVTFDQSDPNFPKLEKASNVGLQVEISAMFNKSINKTDWSQKIDKNVVIDTNDYSDAFAEKTATFDESTGTYNYTIKVTATNGSPKMVNVKDVISGTALIFNNDISITSTGTLSSYTSQTLSDGQKGFNYTFASMVNGEVITITYSAHLDPNELAGKTSITQDMTRNTVTVQKKDGEPHNAEYTHSLDFKAPDKSDGTWVGATEAGDNLYSWTIEYNKLALASARGDVIKDTIATAAQEYMKYFGSVTVKAYDKGSDTPKKSYTFTPGSDSTWTYTIEDDDPYRYVFEYQTVVDKEKVNDYGSAMELKNEAEGPGNHKDTGKIDVGPSDGGATIKKEVQSSSPQEVTWRSTIHVPEGGLNKAVVTDKVPNIYSGNIDVDGNYNIYDTFKNGTLRISGQLPGESYADPEITEDKIVITFYKDADKTQPGLQGTPGGHDIVVTLTTTVDPKWLQYGYDHPGDYRATHKNTIDINGTTDSAEVTFAKEDITKSGVKEGDYYLYTLLLTGVTEEPLVVQDTFNTELLEVATDKVSDYRHFQIWGGNQYNQDYGKTAVNYQDTTTGIKIIGNSLPKQPNGEFYSHYKLQYWLKLKDGVSLEELAVQSGGKYELTNSAMWGEHESSFTFETKYDFLSKDLLEPVPGTDASGDLNRDAKYQIVFNPKKAELNGGEPIEMTDTLSANLSLDYTSVNIVTEPEGMEVPYTVKGGANGTTVATFMVPDSTKVTINYTAQVVATGTGIKYTNTVEVKGEKETKENYVDINIDGAGSGSLAYLRISKVDGYDANKKLTGIKFRLTPVDSTVSLSKNDDYVSEMILETDSNGVLTIDGEQINIIYGKQYRLEEIEPKDGYAILNQPYYFTLVDKFANVDYGNYVYLFNDTFQIKNWPLEGLIIEKKVESKDEQDLNKKFCFKIVLEDGDASDSVYDYDANTNPDGMRHAQQVTGTYNNVVFNGGVAYVELKDGEQVSITGLPVPNGTRYTVSEVDEDGKILTNGSGFTTTVTTTVEGNAPSGPIASTSTTGTINHDNYTRLTFTNKRPSGKLVFTKTVEGYPNKEETPDVTFTVTPPTRVELPKTVFTLKDDFVISGGKYVLNEAAAQMLTGIPVGTYKVTETASLTGYKITASYSLNDDSALTYEGNPIDVIIEEGSEVTVNFSNSYKPRSGDLTVKKVVTGNAVPTESDSFYFKITLTDSGVLSVKNQQYQINNEAGSAITFDNYDESEHSAIVQVTGNSQLTIKNLPAGLAYKVEEVDDAQGTPLNNSTDGKYIVSSGYITENKISTGTILDGTETIATIINDKSTFAELVIKKTIAGNNKNDDDEFTFVVKLTEADGTTPIKGVFDAIKTSGSSNSDTTVSFNANGEATVLLKGGDSMRILKLPNGSRYTVTETVANGYSTKIDSTHNSDSAEEIIANKVGPVTIVGGEAAVYTEQFINTKDSFGSIMLSKSETGNAINPADTFTLKVTFPANTQGIILDDVNTEKNESTDRHGVAFTKVGESNEFVATITVKADGTPVTINNLPNGATYTVSEEGATPVQIKYQTASNSIATTTASTYTGKVDSEFVQIITVTNNVDKFGGLSVEKKLNSTEQSDAEREFKVDVYLYPVVNAPELSVVNTTGVAIDNTTYTTVDAPADMTSAIGKQVSKTTLTLKGGEKLTIRGLDVNSIYYIEEQYDGLNDYAITYTNQSGTIREYSDTESFLPATDNRAIVQNDHLTGELNVQKVVVSNLEIEDNKKFPISITLKNKDGEPLTGTYGGVAFGEDGKNTTPIELGPNEIKTINSLPDGTLYTVEEILTGDDAQQYVIAYSGDVTKDTETKKWSGVIEQGKKKSVTVTNTRNAYGSIKIVKAVEGNDPDKKSWFAVKVTLSDKTFSDTVKAKIGNNYVFDLPFENGVTKPRIEDAQHVQPEDKKRAVEDGFIAITKNDPLIIYGLPVNATYTVEEEDYRDTYEGRTIVYGDSTADSAPTSGTIAQQVYNADRNDVEKYTVEPSGTAVTTVTNTRNRDGKLVLIKLLSGNDISASDEFSFKVRLTDEIDNPISGEFGGYNFDENGELNVTMHGATGVTENDLQAHEPSENGGVMLVIEHLPLHAKFSVQELSNNKGYTIKFKDLLFRVKDENPSAIEEEIRRKFNDTKVSKRTSFSASETVSGDIDVDQRIVVFCNERNTFGKLKIAKTVNALNGTAVPLADNNKRYEFTVKMTDAEGNVMTGLYKVETTGTVEGTTSDSDNYSYLQFTNGEAKFKLTKDAALTFVNLPNGTDYKVTENDYGPDGYKTTIVAQGSTVKEEDREVTGTIGGNTIKEAYYTNTYGRTSVSGVKTWNDEGDHPESVTVELWKKVGVEEVKLDQKVLTRADANADGRWAFSFTNLPIMDGNTEIQYEIREVDVPGYSKRITKKKDDGSWEIVNTKVEEPTFEKKLKDTNDTTGETSGWQDSADYDIGDPVPFKLTAKLANNVTDYTEYRVTLHDTLESGLTLNNGSLSVKVLYADGTVDTSYIRSEDGKSAGDSFAVTLTWGNGKKLIDNEKLNGAIVEVEFQATLNEKAVIGSQGNVNKAYLTYRDNPADNRSEKSLEPDSVIVFTYKVDVKKQDEELKDLTGAEFKLEKLVKGMEPKLIANVKNEAGTVFSFKGLDDGTYILTETKAPAGYRLIEPVTFTVSAVHNPEWESGERSAVLTTLTTAPDKAGDKTTGLIKLESQKNEGIITAQVVDKEAEKPEFEKKVIDTNDSTGETSQPQDSADYDIGDKVPFRLTAKLADNVTDFEAYSITFHDTMEAGKFGEATDIKINMGEQVLSAEDVTAEGESFAKKVTWNKEQISAGGANLNGATVVLTFKAKLLSSANIGSNGNINKAYLEYTNTPGVDAEGKPVEDTDKTPEDAVIVFTYKVEINKQDEKGKNLTGAEFKLEKLDTNGNALSAEKWTPIEAKVNNNTFSFNGLDDGDYLLTETKAPDGFKLAKPIKFTVTAEHNIKWDVTSDNNKADLSKRGSVLTDLNGNLPNGEITLTKDITAGSLTGELENQPPTPPTFEKKVQDINDSTGVKSDWQDSADHDIGDHVPFRLKATLADNVTDYKTYRITFSDTMERGLTFDGESSVNVTVNGQLTTDWSLTKSEAHAFDLMMTWNGEGNARIADEALNSAEVVVEFTATLNKDAVLGKTGNVNTGKLYYSNNPNVADDGKPGTPEGPDTPDNPAARRRIPSLYSPTRW